MCAKPLPNHDLEFDLCLNTAPTHHASLFQVHKTQHGDGFSEFVTPVNNMGTGGDGRYSSINRFVNSYERDHWWIPMDHCYARPWNWRPESTFLKPTKTLFMQKQVNRRRSTNPLAPMQEAEEAIDVETESEKPAPLCERSKVKHLMEECERYAASVKPEEGSDDWEENISKINWTSTQNRLFNGMVKILNGDLLSRLSSSSSHNEPIIRRVTVDKSVERFRKLMATVSWDFKYSQWLHQLLFDNLSKEYLGVYLDILQTLRLKLPAFVDKLVTTLNMSKLSSSSLDSLFALLKRPWDPVAPTLIQDKPKKLPGNPLIVVMPSGPISSKRMLKWVNLFSNLSTVVTIPTSFAGITGHKASIVSCLDQMFVVARNKIQDLRLDYPGRNIVLVGFGFGATLALQVAQVEQVLGVICVGFALHTADGKRGEQDDNLMELQCPILFVIGQCCSTSLQEDMEDLRERMRVETGLIVVGSADDNLRVSKKKKKAEGITQSVVDRCIVDEIGEFISGVILSPYPPQIRQSPTNLTTDGAAAKKAKTERKRYNSNTSSVDSEPPSPTSRMTRPGQNNAPPSLGRPPGTKTKAKWAAQGTSPSPSSSPPPTQIPSTPDTSSNDSTLTDKFALINSDPPPVKKIKILKPTVTSSQEKPPNTSQTKHQPNKAKAINLQNRSLSSLLQSDIPTLIQPSVSKSGGSGIKVLENVKLTGGMNPRFLSNTAKLIDMSKISVLSTKGSSGNSIVLYPDGKIKNLSGNVKTQGGRYITSKRQLIGNKPPRPVKKMSYLPQPGSFQATNLPPPTNLTTQDIMDLPIIFADDNQMIDAGTPQAEIKPVQPQIVIPPQQKLVPTSSNGKFMVINKQNNFIISPNNASKIMNASKSVPKYTKIILSSKRSTTEELKASSAAALAKISTLSPEISLKKVTAPDVITIQPQNELDLENEIMASTVYKPMSSSSKHNITIVSNKEDCSTTDASVGSTEEICIVTDFEENEDSSSNADGGVKRSAEEAEITIAGQWQTNKVPKLD